jgi:cyclopropane fatty-acyl-phospholipid synthase-like methyltransferase
MEAFYNAYYTVTEHSHAHHEFCERVFGKDLCQHGFADMEQLDLLLNVAQIDSSMHVLELGCGNGMITEYLSDCSGAHFTGLDIIPQAIQQAQQRTVGKVNRLEFIEGDINQLEIMTGAYDAILSIDSIYFSQNYIKTINTLKAALRPGGQMAFLYSHGREPWVPKEEFLIETLLPDKTPLAEALKANDLKYITVVLTDQDYELAQKRKGVLIELKPQFEAENAMFILEHRLGDAEGISQAIEEGLHARYLYQVKKD